MRLQPGAALSLILILTLTLFSLSLSSAQQIKVALCQMATTPDKAVNIATATAAIKVRRRREGVRDAPHKETHTFSRAHPFPSLSIFTQEAASNGAHLVVLPEIWNSPYDNAAFPVYAEDVEGGASESATALAAAAAEAGVALVGGSIPERGAGGALFNSCLVFRPDGSLAAKHRKVHLFDIDIPGKITFKESDTLSPGPGPTVVDPGLGVLLGIGICYDLRFPELASLSARRGAQVLVYPGAFNTTTGPAHWELLLRARAVDNQCFVLACSPARDEGGGGGYQAWGHSTAVDPWGVVLAAAESSPAIVYAELDTGDCVTRRVNMPLAAQRRGDVYELVDKTAKG